MEKNMIYTTETIALAKEKASQMIKNGTESDSFLFGKEGGLIFVSTEEKSLIDPKEIEVEGRRFFISIFRK